MKKLLLAVVLLFAATSSWAQQSACPPLCFYPPKALSLTGGTLTGPLLLPDGTAAAPALQLGDQSAFAVGIYRGTSAEIIIQSANANITLRPAAGIILPATNYFRWGNDTFLTRAAAATVQQGAADAAAPINQTLQAQGVAAGTSDVSGANYTITSGNGRGNAAGAQLIFQTPTTVGSGSGSQTQTTRLTLSNTGASFTVSGYFLGVYQTGVLTPATMANVGATGMSKASTLTAPFDWTNAMLTAGGAATSWDVTVITLPAKTQVLDAMVVILTPQTAAGTLTVQCGDTATFVNYVLAGDAKAAANTVYGDLLAERGTAIDVETYYLPSYTATTTVTCRFISNAAMSTMTGSTGRVILTTRNLNP